MAFLRSTLGEYFFVLIVLIAGLFMSLSLGLGYQRMEEAKVVEDFNSVAEDRIEMIRLALKNNEILIRSVASFYLASENITHDEFRIFVKDLLETNPYVLSVAWMPHVTALGRDNFERENKLFIRDRDAEGKMTVSPIREGGYFPLLYSSSPAVDQVMRGYDASFDPVRGDALRRAKFHRHVSASAKVMLMQEETDKQGVVFFMPVVIPSKGRDASGNEIVYDDLRGVIGAGISFNKLIDAALKPLTYSGVNIVIHDMSVDNGGDKLLYARSTRLRKIPQDEIIADYTAGQSLSKAETMDVGGRNWQVSVLATRGFFKTDMRPESYAIIFGGALFTILLSAYMVGRIRNAEKIGQQVEERTRELAAAKKKTDLILLSTHEGIVGVDVEGRITFSNPGASQLLGYHKRELTGQSYLALVQPRHADGSDYAPDQSPLQRVLLDGQTVTVHDEVLWTKAGAAIEVEYTASPVYEGDDVTGAVIIFRDITERRNFEKQLQRMARYDQLTSLANRALFTESLQSAILRAKRSGKKVGVIYVDLNNFKPVNDTLGHAAGDLILKAFADRMKKSVRGYDMPARLGGDEFVILADALTLPDEAVTLAERLIENLKEPVHVEGQEYRMSGSIGIAIYPEHGEDIDSLVRSADHAMYVAKKDKSLKYVVATA